MKHPNSAIIVFTLYRKNTKLQHSNLMTTLKSTEIIYGIINDSSMHHIQIICLTHYLCLPCTDRIVNCSGYSYSDLGVDLTNRTWITLKVQTCAGAYIGLSPTASFAGRPLREFAFDWPNEFYSSGYAVAFAYVWNVFFKKICFGNTFIHYCRNILSVRLWRTTFVVWASYNDCCEISSEISIDLMPIILLMGEERSSVAIQYFADNSTS